jgi:hypothetical protein
MPRKPRVFAAKFGLGCSVGVESRPFGKMPKGLDKKAKSRKAEAGSFGKMPKARWWARW